MKSPPACRVHCTLPLSVLKEVGVHASAENMPRPRMLAILIEEACAHRTSNAIFRQRRKRRALDQYVVKVRAARRAANRFSHEHKN